jgi:hypothetical protein
VAFHYFRVPDELIVVFDGSLDAFPYWRQAAGSHVRALGSAILVLLAAWGTGTLATGWISSRRVPPVLAATAVPPAPALAILAAERLVVGLALGMALLGFLFFVLAVMHLYRPPVTTAVVIISAVAGAVSVLRRGLRMPRLVRFRLADWLFAGCAMLGVGSAFVGALAPESEYDALWYHLWLPAQWLDAGRPLDIVEEYVSLYPLGWDLVGGAAMAMGGSEAATLLHFASLPLAGLTAFLLTERLFPAARPMLAAALAIVTPITIWEATTAYVDVALAWLLAVSVYALVRYHQARDVRWLVISSLVLGGALATKHLALVALTILTGVLWLREWRVGGRVANATMVTAVFVAIALVLPLGWYARAYAASGNPFFPDLYGVFGAEPADRWSPVTERGLQAFKDRFGRERTPRNLLLLPWDATVHAARYGGTLGPLFLILVPAAVLGRRGRRTALIVGAGCAAYIALWASPLSSFQMRFLVPLVPLLAVLGAEGAHRVERTATQVGRPARAVALGVIAGLLLFNLPPTSGWHEPDRRGWDGWMTHIVRSLPLPVVLGAESRDEYLARTVPSYRAWQFIDTALPGDVRILTFSGGDQLYSTRPRIWSDSTRARPATWGSAAGDEDEALAAMRSLGITHVLFDRRMMEDGSVPALAIGSEAMHRCCLILEYEDARFALYRVRLDGGAGTTEAPDSASVGDVTAGSRGSMRHV